MRLRYRFPAGTFECLPNCRTVGAYLSQNNMQYVAAFGSCLSAANKCAREAKATEPKVLAIG